MPNLRGIILATCLVSATFATADGGMWDQPELYCPASKQRVDYGLEVTVRAYKRFGRHNKAWDDVAQQAIGALARSWHHFPRENGDENDVAFYGGTGAMDKGCHDPLLLFAHARALAQLTGPVSDIVALDQRAVEGFRKSKYPSILTATALLRWANDTARAFPRDDSALKDARAHVEEAMALLPKAIAEPKLSRYATVDLLCTCAVTSGHVEGDRRPYLDRAAGILQDAHVPPTDILAGKAQAYYEWAIEDRGTDVAANVPRANMKQMDDALDLATDAANDSLQLDPDNADAARVLFCIDLYHPAAAGRAAAYDLAVKLDPDDERLFHGQLVGLLPQWGGSIQEMVEYARKCAADYKGNGLGALALPEAHWMAAYWADPQGQRLEQNYFESNPQIFDEVKPIYDAYFKTPYASFFHMTRYAVIAAYTGHWKEADTMFKSLGDHRYRWAINNDEGKLTDLVALTARKAQEKPE